MSDQGLACEFLNFQLQSPLVLASGVLGTSATMLVRIAESGAGMVTAKSCGPEPRAGHPNPVVVPFDGGLLNAVGLSNPGVSAQVEFLSEARKGLQPLKVPLIASMFAGPVAEFAQVAQTLTACEPDLIELNISCPNVSGGVDFGTDARICRRLVEDVRTSIGLPVIAKLTPNVTHITEIARA
ncbi:MAG: dihydroorotate dehydrogenase, partial [Anaerolineae bacterium]|nr:dihydroorotate dehydrogenase [Anaerolineae bacterium]